MNIIFTQATFNFYHRFFVPRENKAREIWRRLLWEEVDVKTRRNRKTGNNVSVKSVISSEEKNSDANATLEDTRHDSESRLRSRIEGARLRSANDRHLPFFISFYILL